MMENKKWGEALGEPPRKTTWVQPKVGVAYCGSHIYTK